VRRLAALAAGLLTVFLTSYLVAEAVGVPWLSSPLSAAVAVGLLVGDALLPVPASIVMVALGGIVGFPRRSGWPWPDGSAGPCWGSPSGGWSRPRLGARRTGRRHHPKELLEKAR
jgi:hypothetical protein